MQIDLQNDSKRPRMDLEFLSDYSAKETQELPHLTEAEDPPTYYVTEIDGVKLLFRKRK